MDKRRKMDKEDLEFRDSVVREAEVEQLIKHLRNAAESEREACARIAEEKADAAEQSAIESAPGGNS